MNSKKVSVEKQRAQKRDHLVEKLTLGELAGLKSGDLIESDSVSEMMAHDKELEIGRVRHSAKHMELATLRFDEAAKLILDANDKLMAQAAKTETESKKACKAAKIAVAEIKDQLNKIDSILGDNVENKIQQLERIAAALTTIKALSGDEKTLTIVSALVNK